MIQQNFLVTGMTCSHCVASVTEEVGQIPGVDRVDVVLAVGGSSSVTVTSSTEIARAEVSAAVTEAGYELVEA